MDMVGYLILVWLAANGVLVGVFRRDLARYWREPVFRFPLLILESDDWGAGPLSQAKPLRDIADVLARYRDSTGRAPVVNLALVLAIPDGGRIRREGEYHRQTIEAPMFVEIRNALRDGVEKGVFSLQLHGLEHFWPETLMSSESPQVREWLRQDGPAVTEDLPSHLQSRWIDATSLPSVPLSRDVIRVAVAEEVQTYKRVLGAVPLVVVPPTFAWTREVEAAWAEQGLACVVTPGWRYTRRNVQSGLEGDEGPFANGDHAGKLIYLVRTEYFEPTRGRDAAHALSALDSASAAGRPCLLENHRDNFINDPQACMHSLAELDKLYRQALVRHDDVRFVSSAELAHILRTRDPAWIENRFSGRLPAYLARMRNNSRFWKISTLTGLAGLLSMLVGLLCVGKRMKCSA